LTAFFKFQLRKIAPLVQQVKDIVDIIDKTVTLLNFLQDHILGLYRKMTDFICPTFPGVLAVLQTGGLVV